ncbi:PD-(D/E)XK motif protein [Streptosporangium sp. NPDC023825]|uniref:PD-(D/E)XK motif protein n=1 Tax=Streptosporangium sp. NPDC023825 TaxID=3154909 RepID=UPI003416FB3D
MSITEDDWRRLDTPQGTPGRSLRRLHPESPHDLFIVVTYPSRQRMLLLKTNAITYEQASDALGHLPRTLGLEIRFVRLTRREYELHIALTADELREVFSSLVTDIAAAVQAAPDALSAVVTAINRFQRWQNLLKSVGEEGLGKEERRGLFGELLVLRDFVLPGLAVSDALASWTGPTGTSQDFQLPRLAIEVKTSSARASSEISIASERQLDDTGVEELFLALVVVDERRGGTGASLNTMAESTRAAITSLAAQTLFSDLLVRAGYFSNHRDRYDEPRYTVREIRFWAVKNDFPRIIEPELRTGVSTCAYRIQTAGLDTYRIPGNEVKKIIRGTHG